MRSSAEFDVLAIVPLSYSAFCDWLADQDAEASWPAPAFAYAAFLKEQGYAYTANISNLVLSDPTGDLALLPVWAALPLAQRVTPDSLLKQVWGAARYLHAIPPGLEAYRDLLETLRLLEAMEQAA